MSGERDFIINFGSLSQGEHEFHFEIEDSFFQRFENSLIEKGNVDVLVVLEKKDNMLMLDFTMEGTVTVPCDRCLEDLDLDIESFNELIIKFGSETEELSDNVIMISSKEHELDVSQYIYEYLTLIIPMRNVHDETDGGKGCDPEVIKALEKLKIHETPIDPRWEDLKKINLN
jgi:uncharacterized metal-binding protein YceD (DUF177 family)